jgi:hypothetical protein
MRLMKWTVVALLTATPVAAGAQQPSPSDRALIMSMQMQRLGVEAQELAGALRESQKRIGELVKLCGGPCLPPPPASDAGPTPKDLPPPSAAPSHPRPPPPDAPQNQPEGG